jgi:hypothetical protein
MATGDLTTLDNVKQWLGVTGLTISGISLASPAVITLAARPNTPLVNGASYSIDGVISPSIPNGDYPITVIDASNFSIPVDTTGGPVFVPGGFVGVSDSLLSRLISAASAYMQAWMSRTIALTTYSETRNGVGGQRLPLVNTPVVSVASLLINGAAIPVRPPLGAGSTNAPGGYVNDDMSIMVCGWSFCRGFQNITINYNAGFATTPPDIEQACIDIVGEWFRYMARIGKLSEGIEGQTITFTNAQVPPRALGVMQTYKRVYPVA